ncbi:hypothetical protein DYB32_001066 [Aphanomyces invadans]|uniref:Uncharacterized protein n=1 Tax=Aphanomyces invadans TaxID=157072 RepID=A0A418B7W6_9STRA|nr:hypothetical protein DYB32_001066 [Aphanomyces invadans]
MGDAGVDGWADDPEVQIHGHRDNSDNALTQVLVTVNSEWLADFGATHRGGRGKVPPLDLFLAQKSLWLNDHFQKLRVLTDPTSRQDCEALQDLTKRLLVLFDMRKTTAYLLELSYAPPSPCPATPPKKSPAMLSSLRSPSFTPPTTLLRDKSPFLPQPKVLFGLRPKTTPAARPSPKHGSSPPRSKDKPNKGTSSPPHNRKLPVTLAPLDQIEQRLQSFDLTPPHTNTLQVIPKKTCKLAVPLIHSSVHDTVAPLAPLKSPPRQKATSHHASRDLTSASGFEWWWRTLPANHASLAPHAKLKAVCVAALRMHGAGIFDRAVELYTFALTMMPVPATLQVLPTPEDGDAETVHLPLKLHLNLGSAALSLGQITESVKAFETAIHMDPQSLWAHFKLGMAYNAAGRVEGAVKEWTAVAKLFPPVCFTTRICV